MKDILTVTCSHHKLMMLMQAHTLNKFYTTPTTHYIFLEDDIMSVGEWQEWLQPEYTKHKLVIIPAHSERIVDNVEKLGWFRQQWIKFWASTFIKNDYIILDSKNFFINSMSEDDFPEEGNNRVGWLSHGKNKEHRPFINYVHKKYKLPYYDSFWTIETPFVFRKTVVEKILDLDCKDLFEHALMFLPSEFILYRMASDTEVINARELHNKLPLSTVFWTEEQLRKVNTPIIGMHDYIFFKSHERALDYLEQYKNRNIIPEYIFELFKQFNGHPRIYNKTTEYTVTE